MAGDVGGGCFYLHAVEAGLLQLSGAVAARLEESLEELLRLANDVVVDDSHSGCAEAVEHVAVVLVDGVGQHLCCSDLLAHVLRGD